MFVRLDLTQIEKGSDRVPLFVMIVNVWENGALL